MSQEQLSKVWVFLSLTLTYYVVSSYIVTQGGQAIFGGELISEDRAPAALIAIPVGTILLTASSLVARIFASRATGPWHARLPVVALGPIDTGSREGKAFQALMLVLLSALPALTLVHFWKYILQKKVEFGQPEANEPKCAPPVGSIWETPHVWCEGHRGCARSIFSRTACTSARRPAPSLRCTSHCSSPC